MVSNARLDLPDPERPVTTIRLSRGISTETFFRLCTRAPWTAIVVRAPTFRLSAFIGCGERNASVGSQWYRGRGYVEERELLDHDVAFLRQSGGTRHFAEQSAVREVLAGDRDVCRSEVLLEMILDLPA